MTEHRIIGSPLSTAQNRHVYHSPARHPLEGGGKSEVTALKFRSQSELYVLQISYIPILIIAYNANYLQHVVKDKTGL